MRAFLTVLGDSVRLLRARALFWITLGISLLAAVLYLSIGFDEKGMSLLFGAFHFEEPMLAKGTEGAELMYLVIFKQLIVGAWLSWIAIVIALISCAPIFPEFLTEGSAGVSLSKPLSRPLLFFYKFIGALLFMTLQAALFTVVVFFAIRWRVGVWNPTIFWSVPVLVLVFSYLYAVMAWLGIKTRSVMASVLITLLVWLVCFCSLLTEQVAYGLAYRGSNPFSRERLSGEEQSGWKTAYPWLRIPYVVLPKPGETTGLLDRWIVLGSGKGLGTSAVDAMSNGGKLDGVGEEAKEDLVRHSPAWIIGTSLAFEALVLALACRMFSRRDF